MFCINRLFTLISAFGFDEILNFKKKFFFEIDRFKYQKNICTGETNFVLKWKFKKNIKKKEKNLLYRNNNG